MKYIFYVLAIMIFSQNAFCKDEISISYFNVSPHIIYNTDNQRLEGGAVYEFLEKHIAPEMNIRLKWDPIPTAIPRQIKFLEQGAKDCSALLIYTPVRAEKLIFSANAFVFSQSAIAVHISDPIERIDRVEDLLPYKIGYGKNAYLSPFMKDSRLQLDLIASGNYNEQNFRKLLAGRINAVYTPDIPSLLMVINSMNIEHKIKVLKIPGNPAPLHVVFANHREDLKKKYDKAFKKIEGQKIYSEIIESYLQP